MCVYMREAERGERRSFGNYVNELLIKIGKRSRIIIDVNRKVGSSEVVNVVEKWCVNEVNENGQYLLDIYAERGLFLVNPLFSG